MKANEGTNMVNCLATSAPPELRWRELEAHVERLHLREQEILRDLGRATLNRLPGITSRKELAQIREDLEAVTAALRLLEAAG